MTQRHPVPEDHDVAPESRVRRAIVAVALSARHPAEPAVAVSRLLAKALGAPLHGLFATPTPVAPADVPRLLGASPEGLEGVVIDVEVDEPAAAFAAYAERNHAAFLVVRADESGTDPCSIGPLAMETLTNTNANVVLVRPEARTERLGRVLVPLDGTPSTASAIGPAGELARRAGASLDIVMVGDPQVPPPPEAGAMTMPRYVDQPQHEWPAFSQEFLQRFLRAIGHVPSDVPTRFFLGTGDPGAEILRFSEQLRSDLIALVWHGTTEEKHARTFSTVVRRASCPVLVLRR